jgi:type IV pilus assembly protein PilV
MEDPISTRKPLQQLALKMKKNHGYILIEVLVSFLILSIGLLSVAHLITGSLKSNVSAKSRSIAVVLIDDVIERIRVNKAVLVATPTAYDTLLTATVQAPTANSSIANYDLYNWKTNIAAILPSGQGSISYNTTTSELNVTIQWSDDNATRSSMQISNSGTIAVQAKL